MRRSICPFQRCPITASIDHEFEVNFPELSFNTIPCFERLVEYCDALVTVVSSEIDGMADDARQTMMTLLSELRSYIMGVAVAEIDELSDLHH